jgi:putative membrane protein
MVTTSTDRIRPGFSKSPLLIGLTAFFTIVFIWAAINPLHPDDWVLENVLTILFIILLIVTYKSFPLSDLSYILITLFLILHTIGSHYTYAEVPFGFWLQETFNFSRNHYDRIVHFSFGLLMAYPIREVFLRVAHTKGFWAYYLPLDVTLAFSAIYEIIEMAAALAFGGELGDAYLGTQGDVWDAQKDMLAAATGAVLCMIITAVVRRKFKTKKSHDASLEPAAG